MAERGKKKGETGEKKKEEGVHRNAKRKEREEQASRSPRISVLCSAMASFVRPLLQKRGRGDLAKQGVAGYVHAKARKRLVR